MAVLVAVFRVVLAWQEALLDTLPQCARGQDVRVKLRVDEVQRHAPEHIYGRFVVLSDIPKACPGIVGKTLRLSWRNSQNVLAVRDIVVATVRLKALWGTQNVGGFDYQKWLLASGYNATGYIKSGVLERLQKSQDPSQWVRSVFAIAQLRERGALLALALGDKGQVAPEDWERLQITGTIHLFVVSGLHAGLIGGWLYLLCLACLRLAGLFLPISLHSHRSAGLLALVGIFVYAWLSGMQPPVLRASLMACVVVFAGLSQRRSVPLRMLLLTFILVVVLQPLAVFKQGL